VTSASQVSTVVNNVVEYPSPSLSSTRRNRSRTHDCRGRHRGAVSVKCALATERGDHDDRERVDGKGTEQGRQKTVVVTLGIVGSSYTQITSGLTEARPSLSPRVGQRVNFVGVHGRFRGGSFGGGAP